MTPHRITLACGLLLAAAAVQAQTAAPKNTQVERGRYLVKTTGCNDCHTAGYTQSAGRTPEKDWLQGDTLGWQGPWGTTYATNLRLHFSRLTEVQWLQQARTMQPRPPMPWFGLRDMNDADLKAIYAYIRAAGPAGNAAPAYRAAGPAGQRPGRQVPGVMAMEPLITVFGATGRQGGAVARALLARGGWRVRAVTRQPQAAAARALVALGAEVCRADLDEPASLGPVLQDAQGVFAVTDFWQHLDAQRELRQAANLAEAAAAARGLQQLVWSTLEDTRDIFPADGSRFPLLQGAFNVPHMDVKGEANAFFIDRGLPVTLLLTSFYWDNLSLPGLGPQRAADGTLELALPLGDAPLPGIAVADIGACAAALFDGTNCQRRVGIASDHLSGPDLAALLAEHLREPVRWRDVPLDDFARLPFPGAQDLASMFRFKQIANDLLCAARPVAATRALHPGLQGLRSWLDQQPRMAA